MIFSEKAGDWIVLNTQERKWFARMMIEALFWVNCADNSWNEKYRPTDRVQEDPDYYNFQATGIESFDGLKVREKDMVLWHCLKCACYPNLKINTSLLEAGVMVIIRVLYWKVLAEIDFAEEAVSYGEEKEEGKKHCYSQYRTLFETIYRYLHRHDFGDNLAYSEAINTKVKKTLLRKLGDPVILEEIYRELPQEIIDRAIDDMFADYEAEGKKDFAKIPYYRKLQRKIYPLHPPKDTEMFWEFREQFWIDRLSAIEYSFTPCDYDYQLSPEKAKECGYNSSFINPNVTLGRIRKYQDMGYWDLLFACLREQPIPPYKDLKGIPYKNSWFETIEQTLEPKDVTWLQNNILTTDFIIESQQTTRTAEMSEVASDIASFAV